MFRRLALVTLLALLGTATAQERDARVYEWRVYTAAPGKLADLNARFRDHTMKLFEKHGMTNVGYWVSLDGKDERLFYLLAHESKEAARANWKRFFADPDWQKVWKASEEKGKLVARSERVFLKATDYSPPIRPAKVGDRVFELRIYTTTPGNLDNLNARFRNHTVKLFEKHGMTNVGYWVPVEGETGAKDTLIYILAHKSREAAAESFVAFRKDPAWQKALKASEEKAGGPLTVPSGVKSLFLKATDYSPIR